MIPLHLAIQGLYSYQEKQTIDFTRLTSARLFGIFGAVGCGKSSILEAITFALYGRTSRLNLTGDNRYYNMMNLKSDQLLIEFIFETGKDQTTYMSVVKGKRNSKNFDDVKALDRFAYKKIGGAWVPVETFELEKAIGLSYDNFRRTIIIPQGQFQEFLQLGTKDRTQMMKELFDLGKFEFYYKVASLESKNNALKQTIEGQLLQLGETDEAQETFHQQQLGSLKTELLELEGKLKEYQQQADELKQLQELTGKLAETKEHSGRLQLLEPDYIKLEKSIADYENCVVHFKHLLTSLDECDARIRKKEVLIQQEEKNLCILKAAVGETEKQLEAIKPAYDKREDLKQQAEELDLLVRIKELQSTISKSSERLKNGMSVLEKTRNSIDELTKNKASLESLIKLSRQDLPNTTVLANVKAWHVENDGLKKQSIEIESQIDKYNKEVTLLNQNLHSVFADPAFEQLHDKTSIPAVLLYLAKSRESLRKHHTTIQQDFDELRVKVQLQQYAGELKEGKACPLCGSLNHPEVYKTKDINELNSQIKELKYKNEKDLEKNHELEIQLNNLQSRIHSNVGNLNEWKEKKEELLKKAEAHQEAFEWDKYRLKEELDEAFTETDKIQSFIKEKEEELGKINKDLEKETKNKEVYRDELEKIKDARTVSQTQVVTLQEQISVIVSEQYEQSTALAINREKVAILETYYRLEQQHVKLTRQLEEHNKNASNLSGGLDAIRNELVQEKETLQVLAEQLDEQLKKTTYNAVDEVRVVLAQPIILEQEKKKLADFRHQQALVAEKYRQLQVEINNRTYETEVHQKLVSEIETCKELWRVKNQAVGNLTGLLVKLQHDLEQKTKLVKEQEKLELRAENIKTMKSLFKASGFVNYISSVYLQNLCNAANDRFFQLTRQKLSLEITPDNNFQVRDFMNGGKVRNVKTLSGGQTFQAALSLALALADNIQKITESNQNFFFLDEGFGSLDKESLAVVFDTLKTLRKENRIVGVISHVDEMQQEIDVHLQIEHQEERGSIIHPGWMGRV